MLTAVSRTTSVLELGSFTGYSALCFAEGLAQNLPLNKTASDTSGEGTSLQQPQIHTCEIDTTAARLAQKYFDKSGYSDNIMLHQLRASDLISKMRDEGKVFDMYALIY